MSGDASSSAKRRIKLEIAYDGRDYHGWQRQQDLPTIQGTIEKALHRLVRRKVHLLGSGRTDAGVHAIKQVATFSTAADYPPEIFQRALNAMLPPTIRIRRAEEVPFSFHPIRDIRSKRYRYIINDGRPSLPFLEGYAWIHHKPLDLKRMRQGAKHLLGTRDFAAFQSTGSPRESTIRTVFELQIDRLAHLGLWQEAGGKPSDRPVPIVVEIEADGFLYNMVRAIVGTLALVGTAESAHPKSRGYGKPPEWIAEILASGKRSDAGATAPPQGLYMLDVRYEPKNFSR